MGAARAVPLPEREHVDMCDSPRLADIGVGVPVLEPRSWVILVPVCRIVGRGQGLALCRGLSVKPFPRP